MKDAFIIYSPANVLCDTLSTPSLTCSREHPVLLRSNAAKMDDFSITHCQCFFQPDSSIKKWQKITNYIYMYTSRMMPKLLNDFCCFIWHFHCVGKSQKMSQKFIKRCQTVLPERSIFIGQKWVENSRATFGLISPPCEPPLMGGKSRFCRCFTRSICPHCNMIGKNKKTNGVLGCVKSFTTRSSWSMTSPCFDIHKGQQRQQETERACAAQRPAGSRQAGSKAK